MQLAFPFYCIPICVLSFITWSGNRIPFICHAIIDFNHEHFIRRPI